MIQNGRLKIARCPKSGKRKGALVSDYKLSNNVSGPQKGKRGKAVSQINQCVTRGAAAASVSSARATMEKVMRNHRDRHRSSAPPCQLETLESRALMSAGMSIDHGILNIRGTEQADVIRITRLKRNAANWIVRINSQKIMLHPGQISQIVGIVVHAGAGDDQVFLDGMDTFWGKGPSGWGQQGVDRPCVVMGGLGDDTITGSYADDELDGGPGDDKIAGSAGDDTVRGGAGDDVLAGDDFTGIREVGVFPDPEEPPSGRFTPHVDLNTWLWERFLRIVNEEHSSHMFQPVASPDQVIDGGPGRDQAPIFDASDERLWNIESYPGQKVQLVGILRPSAPGAEAGEGDTQIVGNHFVLQADSSKVSDQAAPLMNRKVFVEGTLGYQSVYTAWLHTIIHIEKIQTA
jgi:hypothetical protein